MLQQAARAVRQQVAARVGVASSSKAPSALRAAAVVPRAQAAAAAAFHSAAAPLASASASSQRDEQAHSSSSASASSLSASSIALLGALVSSVGGVWLLRSNEVAAEAAAVGMPEVAAASDASTLDAAPRKKKKKGSKKRGAAAVTDSDPRPTLANPGKLSQFHSSISEVTNIQTWQGLQIVWVSQAWPQGGGNELMSKQVQLQVVGGMGGPQGDWAQMQLNTSLGHAHGFEGVIATGGVVQGGYTLSALDQKLTIKPSFQLTPNGNGCELSADYRGQEWTANLGIHPMQADLSFAFSHALTKSLSMGSELHLSLVNPAHLNAGIKYKTKKESWALSKKDSAYQASYCREIHREGPLQPDEAGSIPDLTSVLGADLKVNPSSGKSDLTVGIKHSRHSYNYHAAINTEPRVEFTADFEPLAGAPVRLGMCASVPYTGKAEDVASFGISMTLQL